MHPLRAPTPLPLGNSVSSRARPRRLAGASYRAVFAGEVVIREGEVPEAVFAVESGALSVSCAGSRARGATLVIVGPGEAFGLEALTPTDGPSPTLLPETRALMPSRVLAVPLAQVRVAGDLDPQIGEWLLEAMSMRLDGLGRRLVRSLTLSVVDHVHVVLCELARIHGRATSDWIRIELPLSQEGIAALVGTTRESVNRALGSLATRGLVRRSGRSYLIRTGSETDAHSCEGASPNLRSGP